MTKAEQKKVVELLRNDEEYYNIKGKSITKSLMKTPINGARLSSSYGMRKHPILGFNTCPMKKEPKQTA